MIFKLLLLHLSYQ